jgi:peptidoglycan/xylan/chitin deacetylase (PgdA/CDA1 family)
MSRRRSTSRLRRFILPVFVLLALAAPAWANAAPTVVSLTFDDGRGDQYVARSILEAHGMDGTFFVNSNDVGAAGHLSWSQLGDLYADGNEIAGHTLDHVHLTTVSSSEAQRQICDDRRKLWAHGFPATDFAYPGGAQDSSLYPMLQGCGYNSARSAWGLCAPWDVPSECAFWGDPYAETIPPRNRWDVRTQPSLRTWTTLAELQAMVTNAEGAGGGWVPIVFHSICDGCDPDGYSTSQATFQAFLDWLAPRSANGTTVRTVAQVIGGPTTAPPASTTDPTAPSSSITCNDAVCGSGWYTVPVSVALSATDASGIAVIRYTTDGSDPSATSPVYAGPFTVSATTTVKFRAWDNANNAEATRSQLISVDSTAPASTIACNGGPCSSTPYNAPVSVSLSATDAASGVELIRYTTDGSDPTVASPTYSAPFTVAATTTVRYRAWDNAGNVESTKAQSIQIDTTPTDTTPPTSTIACNASGCSSGWYAGAVSVTLSAVDSGGSGVATIRYTTNGSEPTASSSVFTGPFTVSTTATVRYRAWDTAGNVEATKSQLIQIDTTAPQVTLTSPISGATVTGVVRLEATASDVGSGVARVEFYVDGKLEGTTTLLPYRINWNTNTKKVSKGSHTIYAVVFDRAGNSRTTTPITVTVR